MSILAQLQHDDRSGARHVVELEGTLREHDFAPRDVFVDDLSVSGFRMATSSELQIGAEFSIGFGGIGSRTARAVWRSDVSYGCEFDQPLSYSDIATVFSAGERQPVLAFPSVAETAFIAAASNEIDATARLSYPMRLRVIAATFALAWVALIGTGYGVSSFF